MPCNTVGKGQLQNPEILEWSISKVSHSIVSWEVPGLRLGPGAARLAEGSGVDALHAPESCWVAEAEQIARSNAIDGNHMEVSMDGMGIYRVGCTYMGFGTLQLWPELPAIWGFP